jgi:putative salt-induced outer membrane protein YdiY
MKNFLICTLLTLLALQTCEAKKWKQSLSLGMNVARGNTETTQFNTRYDARKKNKKDSYSFKIAANFGEDKVKKNTDNHLFGAQYNRIISQKYFWLVNTSYEVDHIADLDYRYQFSPGLGYKIIDKEDQDWDIEAGLGYQVEKYDLESSEGSMAYRFAEKWNYDINKNASLWHSAEISGRFDEGEDYIIKAVLGVQSKIAGNLSLKSFIKDKYTNVPARRKKKNDFSFNTVLVYSF